MEKKQADPVADAPGDKWERIEHALRVCKVSPNAASLACKLSRNQIAYIISNKTPFRDFVLERLAWKYDINPSYIELGFGKPLLPSGWKKGLTQPEW